MRQSKPSLRIIGGKWRSRKIDFIPLKGVRPTTDAARETLFNWLAPIISGASCLELFAGSGSLGFEALSRGAKHIVMSDISKKIIINLKNNAKTLETTDITFCCAKIPQQLYKIPNKPFNIIFIDPPFGKGLVELTCQQLLTTTLLNNNPLIYIEAEKSLSIKDIVPNTWSIYRHKIIGQTQICLLQI